MEKKSVLILGATGLVGGWCVKKALEQDSYGRVAVIVRRSLLEKPVDPRFEEHVISFDAMGEHEGLFRADHVICALGTTLKKAKTRENFRRVDFGYALEAARLALGNGARHFLLVSAAGANPKSLVYYSRVKGELEEAVSALGYAGVSIFRPSFILGAREEYRRAEEFAKSVAEHISFAIPKRYKPIEARTVACAMVRAALTDEPGKHVYESDAIQDFGA